MLINQPCWGVVAPAGVFCWVYIVSIEEAEVRQKPEIEVAEVVAAFESYGLTAEESTPVVDVLIKRSQAWVDFMMRIELGLEKPDPKRALTSALTIAGAYIAGGFVPLSPYFVPPYAGTDEINFSVTGTIVLTGSLPNIIDNLKIVGSDPELLTISGNNVVRVFTVNSGVSLDLSNFYVCRSSDTNGVGDIFVRDLQAGQTIRVSVASDGTEANGASNTPSISADGHAVAFESVANNLVISDTNGFSDVYLYDTGGIIALPQKLYLPLLTH